MPTWLIILIVVAVLILALVLRVRRPTELERLGQEVSSLIGEERFSEALPIAERAVEAAQQEVEEWRQNLGSDHSDIMVTG